MAYTAVTLAELKIGMAQRWDGSVFWTEEEARLAINEALRDWNLLVARWHTTLTISTGAGTVEYSIATSLTYGTRVKRASGAPVFPTSIIELDLARPTWRSETIASGGAVPTVVTFWAPISLQRIAIWPATAGGVNDLIVEGIAATPVLVEDADTVDVGQELHDPLLDYALHVVSFKEGGPRWRLTMEYYRTFLQLAAQENSLLKASKAYRRWAGLDRTRDYRKTLNVPTQIDALGQKGEQG
jgi:hypothetical protein